MLLDIFRRVEKEELRFVLVEVGSRGFVEAIENIS